MPKPSLQNITPIYNEKILIKVGIENVSQNNRASLVAQMVKNLSVMQETQVQSLGQEGSLEKGITTHYHYPVFLPGEFHGQRSLVGCSPWGCRRLGH